MIRALQRAGQWLRKWWKLLLGAVAGLGLMLAIGGRRKSTGSSVETIKEGVNEHTARRLDAAETQHGVALEQLREDITQEAEEVRERGPEATEQWLNDMDRKIRMDRLK